jgi:hypothetical protein
MHMFKALYTCVANIAMSYSCALKDWVFTHFWYVQATAPWDMYEAMMVSFIRPCFSYAIKPTIASITNTTLETCRAGFPASLGRSTSTSPSPVPVPVAVDAALELSSLSLPLVLLPVGPGCCTTTCGRSVVASDVEVVLTPPLLPVPGCCTSTLGSSLVVSVA